MKTLNFDGIYNMKTYVGEATQALDVSENAIKFKNTQEVTVQSKDQSLYNFKDLHANKTIDDKTAAKNWYVRQQLLDKIRTDLAGNGVENVTENSFFKDAEQELFGKDANGAYEAEVGLSDLTVATAQDLLRRLQNEIALVSDKKTSLADKDINLQKQEEVPNEQKEVPNEQKEVPNEQKEVPNEQKVENKPEVKVGKTQLEAARKSCEKYIKMLKAQREEQLQIIKNAGFTSDADKWILDNLKAKYDYLIDYVQTDILDTQEEDPETIEDALGLKGGGLAKLKEPLTDEQLKAVMFSDVKAALSRTLCSLMLFSQYEFKNATVEGRLQIAEKLAEELADVFELTKPEDFTTKLDRVKAWLQSDNSSCIVSQYMDILTRFVTGEKIEEGGMTYECASAARQHVRTNCKITGFVSTEAFKSKLSAYLKNGTALTSQDVKSASLSYLQGVQEDFKTTHEQLKEVPNEQKVVPNEQKVVPNEQKVVPNEQEKVAEEQKEVPNEQKKVAEEQKEVPNEQKVENKPEVKVGKTQLEAARKSCEKYIKMLKAQREEQLQIIKNAGFTSDADKWILDDLCKQYDQALSNAKKIMAGENKEELTELLRLTAEDFEDLKEPVADEELRYKVFRNMESALSKTLCLLAQFSEYDFDKDEDRGEMTDDIAKKYSSYLCVTSNDDFKTMLGRIKKLIQPEGVEKSTCIKKFFDDFVAKFIKRGIEDKYYKFEDPDLDYIAKKANFGDFVASRVGDGFFWPFVQYLRDDKPIKMEEVGLQYMETLQGGRDNPMTGVRDYLHMIRNGFDNVFSGRKTSVGYAKAFYQAFYNLNLTHRHPSDAFGGIFKEIEGEEIPSDDELSLQCSTPDNLIHTLEENFLKKMKSGYEKLLAKTDDLTKQKILKFQQEKEEKILNGIIRKIRAEADSGKVKPGTLADLQKEDEAVAKLNARKKKRRNKM